jgi:hypothetical protein
MRRIPIESAPLNLNNYFNEVNFNKKYHKYYVNGKEFTSCTTFLSRLKKDIFNDSLKEKTANKRGVTIDYLNDLWDIKREIGCLRGTEIHFLIETYYKYGFFSEYSDLVNTEYFQFKKFIKDHLDLEPVKIEWIVYDKELEIAGTLDMLFKNKMTGKFELYDWKTNKEIKLSSDINFINPLNHLEQSDINIYSMQLSIYKHIIEKNTPVRIDSMYIVHFNKDSNYEKYEAKYMEKELDILGF